MKTTIKILNPAGNITALVPDITDPEQRKRVSEYLMQNKDTGIEQVAFITEPLQGGSIRAEMMGGEFCGNALRCAALYYMLSQGEQGQAIVPVEISGNEAVIAVAVNTATMEARATMPLPKRSYQARIDDNLVYVCDFGGIVHFVLPEAVPDQDLIDDLLQYAIVHFEAEAFGLIFANMESNLLCPVVFVPAVGTLVFENSCASGTLAASVYMATKLKNGRHSMEWQQPGGTLAVDLKKVEGKITQLVLSGKISLCDDMEIDLDKDLQPAEIRNIDEIR